MDPQLDTYSFDAETGRPLNAWGFTPGPRAPSRDETDVLDMLVEISGKLDALLAARAA